MATSQSILDSLSDLNERLVETAAMARTFTDLAGVASTAPQWPFVVECHVQRISDASERLETLLRQQALPVLRDMESASRHV